MIAAELKIIRTDELGQSIYECPECIKTYTPRWIKRHLVSVHGYKYWGNSIVYNPEDPANKENL